MKLRIELDEETQKEWACTKEDLNSSSGSSKRVTSESQIQLCFNVSYIVMRGIETLPLNFVGNFESID